MYFGGGLGLLLMIAMIIHCIKTGRNTIWVIVIIAVPVIGSLVYAAVEILPDLMGSRGSRRAMRNVRDTFNPEGELRRLENEVKVSGTVGAKIRYAEELMRLGRAAEAVSIYRSCLTGVFAEDPKLLLGYARAQFETEDFAGARATLDDLIQKNPEFKSPDGHLLYARALEAEGNREKALEEYATLAGYYPGAEAGVRYARLLKAMGQTDAAREQLQALLERAKYAPPHVKRAQADWLDEAAREARN